MSNAKCPKCQSQEMQIVDIQGDGDELTLTMGCKECKATFRPDENKPEPHPDDPWWIDVTEQELKDYLAQFSGE